MTDQEDFAAVVAAARERLVREAVELAKFHRRGPLADDPDPEPPWNEALGRVVLDGGDE